MLSKIRFILLFPGILLLAADVFAASDDIAQSSNTSTVDQTSEQQVIKAFTSSENVESDIVAIEDREKRLIMFVMGIPLLIFIFITAGLGIAMGVYGKDVFVAHMVFAGLSLTLALAHAIVGVVWFYPF